MQKLLVCDDHSIVRRGLKNILTTHFTNLDIDECHSISETLCYLQTTTPDYAIFDLQLSDGNMLDKLPAITTSYPNLNILIYSMCNEDVFGKRALQIGAKGFLTKAADDDEVVRALQIFLSGQNYLSARLNNVLINSLRNKKHEVGDNPFTGLSNREIEVTQYLLAGKSLKEISSETRLHANTIVTYKNRIFEKLEINNIIELNNLARLYHFE